MTELQERPKLKPSFWLSLIFLAMIAAGVVTAARWRWDTRLFPWVVGIPALILAFCQLVADFRGDRAGAEQNRESTSAILDISLDGSLPPDLRRRATLRALTWIGGFMLAIWLIGFLLAIPLFVFSYLRRDAEAGVPAALASAACTLLFIWAIFDFLMNLAWPAPVLFNLFR